MADEVQDADNQDTGEEDDSALQLSQPKLKKVVHLTFDNLNGAAMGCPPLTRDQEITLQMLLAEYRMANVTTISYDPAKKYRLLQCNVFDRTSNSLCDSFVVKLTNVRSMVLEVSNIRNIVPKMPNLLTPTVGGTAWFNDCGSVRIRYPGRWCYPSLQPKPGIPPPVLATLHDFYAARLGRLQRGDSAAETAFEVTSVIGDVFNDHLFGVREQSLQPADINLFKYYQIEDMITEIVITKGGGSMGEDETFENGSHAIQ